MGFCSDLKVLYHMAVRPVRGEDHASRMENFYEGQAEAYDSFRERLLKGRCDLFAQIDAPDGGIWLDMGGGTGANVEFIPEARRQRLGKVYVVDLASSLLEVASRRFDEKGWQNCCAVEADATTYAPPEVEVDVVTFSYSLTMIPDWFSAVDHALKLLKPGGLVGVVDFYVSRKHVSEAFARHSWLTRTFWPAWFATDNVFPSPDHVPYLHERFEPVYFDERRTRIPYFPVPMMKMAYYLFIGRKPNS